MLEMECSCVQKKHTAPVKTVEVGEHAVEKIGEILSEYKSIFLVADENTYHAAGKRAEALLKEKGYATMCVGKWGLGGPKTPTRTLDGF